MTAEKRKAAFVEKFVAEWEAMMVEASDRRRRTLAKPHPETAWYAHMVAVVSGAREEAPATGGREPEYSDEFGAFRDSGGMVLRRPGGIRASVAATVGRDGETDNPKPWVLVMLPTGPAAMVVEEAYALGAREQKFWPEGSAK